MQSTFSEGDSDFQWLVLGIRIDKNKVSFYQYIKGAVTGSVAHDFSAPQPFGLFKSYLQSYATVRGSENSFAHFVIFYDSDDQSQLEQVNKVIEKLNKNDHEALTIVALSNTNAHTLYMHPNAVNIAFSSEKEVDTKIQNFLQEKIENIQDRINISKQSKSFTEAFDKELEIIKDKAQNLQKRKYQTAFDSADKLVNDLKRYADTYSKSEFKNEDYEKFHSESVKAIQEARTELEKHRGWRRILSNTLVAVATLGVFYPIARLIIKKKTGSPLLFNKSDSAQKLDRLQQAIDTDKKIKPK